jgi:hypothetical protein
MANVHINYLDIWVFGLFKNPDGTYKEVNLMTDYRNGLQFNIGSISPKDYQSKENTAFSLNTYTTAEYNITGTTSVMPSAGLRVQRMRFVLEFQDPKSGGQQQVDYSTIEYPNHECKDMCVATASGDTKSAWLSSQVADPRQNLNENDWPPMKVVDPGTGFGSAPYGGGGGGTPNKVNNFSLFGLPSCANTSPDKDRETSPDPVNISTAYIRNDVMLSPWELGAIHRGAVWQTINLHKYNPSRVMGGYAGGDANILDQIKMTEDLEVYGKFNVNCGIKTHEDTLYVDAQKESLRLLTMGITTGTTYEDPIAGGTPALIDQTKADTIADSVVNDAPGHGKWLDRSQIIATPELIKNCSTDAEQEEIAGKFINLCKAGTSDTTIGTSAKIIVLAQAIKDIGGVKLSKDLNYDGVIDANATDKYDANGNTKNNDTINEKDVLTTFGIYDPMFDEIISSTKIIGVIKLDGGKWVLNRYMYSE